MSPYREPTPLPPPYKEKTMSIQEFEYRQTRVAVICLCIAFIVLVAGITTCSMRSESMELKLLKDRQMTCPCRPQ